MGRRRIAIAAVAAVAVALAGGALALHQSARAPSGRIQPPAASPSPAASPAPPPSAGLKPEISGLLDRQGVPPDAYAGALGGFVVNARWADLQPAPGGPIADGNAIDAALAEVRRLNAAHPGLHLAIKLRIFAGVDSPDWAKSLGGAPVMIHALHGNVSGTVPRFWTPAFGAAYAGLMSALAARYDSTPELEDVTISRCMTVYAEPFIRDVSDRATTLNLLAAGFTAGQDQACETAQIDEARAWKKTHLSLSFNPYQRINPDGSAAIDEAFTEQVMRYCRSVLGPQCVLENNSIRTPSLFAYQPMYAAMQALGPPLAFQTAVGQHVGSLAQTVEWAIAAGADCVEVPQGYAQVLSAAELSAYSQRLRAARQA